MNGTIGNSAPPWGFTEKYTSTNTVPIGGFVSAPLKDPVIDGSNVTALSHSLSMSRTLATADDLIIGNKGSSSPHQWFATKLPSADTANLAEFMKPQTVERTRYVWDDMANSQTFAMTRPLFSATQSQGYLPSQASTSLTGSPSRHEPHRGSPGTDVNEEGLFICTHEGCKAQDKTFQKRYLWK